MQQKYRKALSSKIRRLMCVDGPKGLTLGEEDVRFYFAEVLKNDVGLYAATRYKLLSVIAPRGFPESSTVRGWIRRLGYLGYLTKGEVEDRVNQLHDLEAEYDGQLTWFMGQYKGGWQGEVRMSKYDMYINPLIHQLPPETWASARLYGYTEVNPIPTTNTIHTCGCKRYLVYFKLKNKTRQDPPHMKMGIRTLASRLEKQGWVFKGSMGMTNTPECDVMFKRPGDADWQYLIVSSLQQPPYTQLGNEHVE